MLRDGGSEHHHVLWVDCEVLSRFSVGEPCQLHDRAAGRVEDDPFDVLGVSLDAVAVAGQDGYLRCVGSGLQRPPA